RLDARHCGRRDRLRASVRRRRVLRRREVGGHQRSCAHPRVRRRGESNQSVTMQRRDPDVRGYFGEFGGRYVPETRVEPVEELEREYFAARDDREFHRELDRLLKHYVGRPTPVYEAARLTQAAGGATIYLKREDLTHTGAHKINNALGQALLAQRM